MASDGCISDHTILITDRGGARRVAQLQDVGYVQYSRVRDSISEGRVDIAANYCTQQSEVLQTLIPPEGRGSAVGRYEMVIFRGTQRMWEGPITRATATSAGVSIFAKDVLHYASRTLMEAAYDNQHPNVTTVVDRAQTILTAELGRAWEIQTPPIDVVPHIVVHNFASEANTAAYTYPMQKLVFEEIDGLARRSGMDYTVVGRAIHLWDTSNPIGITPQATAEDFFGDQIVSVYGMELGVRAVVTDGLGNFGEAGGTDPYYGPVEILDTAYDETEGADPPTAPEMASQAQRNLAGRNPTPLQVRVPDNSSIRLGGAFSLENLVPGVYVPLVVNFGWVEIKQVQKIKQVTFKEGPEGETIELTLFPASQPDEESA